MTAAPSTPWTRGRLDGRRGPRAVLFGRMYEDPAIELAAFRPGGRVCCIASAGCTAMALAPHHRVVAVDINPDQLAYAARRLAGAPAIRGTAERVMDVGRALAPAVGWSRARVARFLALDDPAAQVAYWHDHLATRRLRAILDALLSRPVLRAAYASTLLAGLPPHLGRTMRARLVRGFARHPNRTNPYARALLLGDLAADAPPPEARGVELVHADLAAYLEGVPAASFDAFTLSNILDGAAPAYAARLSAAVRRAAAPGAVVVRRSFGEPVDTAANRADDDRALLWGVVDVRAVADLRP